MRGVIKTRHLVTHGVLIVRQFGVRAYLRCLVGSLRHPGRCTFLGSIH